MKKNFLILTILTLFISTIFISGCNSSQPKANDTPKNPAPSENKLENAEITLYFSDDQAMYLVPEKRTVKVKDSSNLTLMSEAIIKELIKGPKDSKLGATIPKEARLLSVSIQDKTAYVNFSEEIRSKHPGGSTGEGMTLNSIANSLTELKGIEKIQVQIEGKNVDTLVGHWDLSQPLIRNENIISSNR